MSSSEPVEPRYTVAAVARRLGVAPATLRTWDRRYGLGPSEHASGAHRRYSADDLDRLQTMRRLTLDGVAPADAARLALGRINGVPAAAAPPEAPARGPGGPGGRVLAVPGAPPDVRGLARAAFALDAPQIGRALNRTVAEQGVVAAWDGLIRPVLTAIGDRWEATGLGVDVEHLVSECAIGALNALRAEEDPPGRPVLLACAEEEAHSLPLHALRAGLVERSIPARLLGAATPSGALVAAIRRIGPSALVLWSQRARTGRTEQLAAVPVTRPPLALFVGGPGWAGAELPARATYVESLASALDLIEQAVRG